MNYNNIIGFETKFKRIEDIKDLLKFGSAINGEYSIVLCDYESETSIVGLTLPLVIDKNVIDMLLYSNICFEFLKAEIYHKNEDTSEIKTYKDYKDSKCVILLLIVDAYYVELYCKDGDLLKKIIEHIKNYDLYFFDYKTEKNDCRTSMDYY